MAKSVLSTLVGIAVDRGDVGSIDDPVTRWLPDLARRDPGFSEISLRDLLTMSSGLRYVERGLPWSDDALTYYSADLRRLALDDTRVERPPGERWHYNNFNPLLLGLVLERATGRRIADYMAATLWGPLGAEADASWSTDAAQDGFEKSESGVNARARDFARFGLLALRDGRAGRRQVVSRRWLRAATGGASGAPVDFYGAMWWVDPQHAGGRDPFYARGHFGQVIAVVPERDVVVVRLGSDDAGIDWAELALDIAQRAGSRAR